MRDGLTGRLSTGLGCWPKSLSYLGCRVGRSERQGTVYVYVCVSDALQLSSHAIHFQDVYSVVTSKVTNVTLSCKFCNPAYNPQWQSYDQYG